MTGQHMGHTHVRGNAGGNDMLIQSLRDEDLTVAEVLHSVGYTNALIGKWGLGEIDQPGSPLKQGFDRFFGYLNQVQSSRRLEREAQRNVELMWLTGRLAPDFKTIAEAIRVGG